jgi:hypothetical protein
VVEEERGPSWSLHEGQGGVGWSRQRLEAQGDGEALRHDDRRRCEVESVVRESVGWVGEQCGTYAHRGDIGAIPWPEVATSNVR